jgi:hypothetical protein
MTVGSCGRAVSGATVIPAAPLGAPALLVPPGGTFVTGAVGAFVTAVVFVDGWARDDCALPAGAFA